MVLSNNSGDGDAIGAAADDRAQHREQLVFDDVADSARTSPLAERLDIVVPIDLIRVDKPNLSVRAVAFLSCPP